MSRVEIQDMFEDTNEDDEENEDVEEEEEEVDEEHGGNGAQAGSNEFKKFSAKLWKSDLPKKVHETFGYPMMPWSMTESIMHSGEVHMQSVEIVEQVLLLVHHLAQVSYLCRITLIERDITKILNRILDSMPQNVYIMALVEVTNEALNCTE